MIKPVQIGDRWVGEGYPCYIVAEIGINHNGELDTAWKLIDAAADAGCDAVKFQKRDVSVVYTHEELARPRENPFGSTNGDLKRGLEFGYPQYMSIEQHCQERGIAWFASCWNEGSVAAMSEFEMPAYKIASASLTDDRLLRFTRDYGKPIILSTGMSTIEQIDHAVDILGTEDLILLHCTSTYPSKPEELNLRCLPMLQDRYGVPVGYSSHSVSPVPPLIAASMGAVLVEVHLTLDRSMWGSDQAASLEPGGLAWMVKHIGSIPVVMGDSVKKVYDSELPILEKLRRNG